jgi:PTH2 family peptidyl-tRNA hydrolase
MEKNTKQVLVWRNDLKVRKGKFGAQLSHASMAFLTCNHDLNTFLVDEFYHWLHHSFRKIVCYVDNEEELVNLHERAIELGLCSHLIEDNGATEFHGVPTKTCIAIGPHWDEKFVGLTDNLPLL